MLIYPFRGRFCLVSGQATCVPRGRGEISTHPQTAACGLVRGYLHCVRDASPRLSPLGSQPCRCVRGQGRRLGGTGMCGGTYRRDPRLRPAALSGVNCTSCVTPLRGLARWDYSYDAACGGLSDGLGVRACAVALTVGLIFCRLFHQGKSRKKKSARPAHAILECKPSEMLVSDRFSNHLLCQFD